MESWGHNRAIHTCKRRQESQLSRRLLEESEEVTELTRGEMARRTQALSEFWSQ